MLLQTDQSLICPQCGEVIKLTESLAAPLVAATRAEYEKKLKTQGDILTSERSVLEIQQQANDRRAAELEATAKGLDVRVAQQVEAQLTHQLALDRKSIAEQESVRARQQVEDELNTQKSAAQQLAARIQTLTLKLTTAQAAEADLLKKRQEFEDKERELELNLQKGIASGLEQARAQALAEAAGRPRTQNAGS